MPSVLQPYGRRKSSKRVSHWGRLATGLRQSVTDLLGVGVEQSAMPSRRAAAARSHIARSVSMIRESRTCRNLATLAGSTSFWTQRPYSCRWLASSGYISSKWISHARRWKARASAQEAADVGERAAGEVVRLEVAEGELQLPLALLPRGFEVAQEPRQGALEASGTKACLPLRRDGSSDAYGNGPPSRTPRPRPAGNGNPCAADWVPHAEQSVTKTNPSGEKPCGQWKSANQNRASSALVNGPGRSATHGDSMCSGVQPGYHSRNWSTGTTSATAINSSPRHRWARAFHVRL